MVYVSTCLKLFDVSVAGRWLLSFVTLLLYSGEDNRYRIYIYIFISMESEFIGLSSWVISFVLGLSDIVVSHPQKPAKRRRAPKRASGHSAILRPSSSMLTPIGAAFVYVFINEGAFPTQAENSGAA